MKDYDLAWNQLLRRIHGLEPKTTTLTSETPLNSSTRFFLLVYGPYNVAAVEIGAEESV